jgi:hypothetical protein
MRGHHRTLTDAVQLAALAVAGLALAACTGAPAGPAWTAAPAAPAGPPLGPVVQARVVEVFRSPTCSCCHDWEAYMRSLGWTVQSVETDDMTAIKRAHNLPAATWSCHTALIDGYVVEGHVPIAAIEDLLEQRPAIDGIALPGMPAGSPGMPAGSPGMPGVPEGPLQVLAVDDGSATAFGAY